METQELLGADIQMVLDVCPPLPSPESVIKVAVRRTAAWAAVARAAHCREDQALFGIVQGGVDEALRRESALRTVELDFDGYGIGGLSVGETREEMVPAIAAATAQLPESRPRYLMGVGDPASLVAAVAHGVDQFDCVMQTRLGRHGTALTSHGKLHMKNAAHASSDAPLDATLPVRGVRPPQPRLPPPPVPGRRAVRIAPAQPAQHRLDPRSHGQDPGGDRSRNVLPPAGRSHGRMGLTGAMGSAIGNLARCCFPRRLVIDARVRDLCPGRLRRWRRRRLPVGLLLDHRPCDVHVAHPPPAAADAAKPSSCCRRCPTATR